MQLQHGYDISLMLMIGRAVKAVRIPICVITALQLRILILVFQCISDQPPAQ